MMKNGFALPTVLIASVVMMMVLLSGLTSASSINTAIRSQHYNKMAQRTAESGIAFTQACLKKNNNVAQWSNASKLRPNTDCSGVADGGYTCVTPTDTLVTIDQRCAVVKTDNVLTTFEVSGLSGAGAEKVATVTARVYLIRSSSSSGIVSSSKVSVQQSVVFKNNPAASRPAKKFWLFGANAGLDFGTSGTNVASARKCATGQSCEGNEGTTVISTRDGTLQFWTDGRTIWNRNGVIMNGGLDTAGQPVALNASQSATQAAAVLPIGSDETRYVIITNNSENGHAQNNIGELFYSIVDMTQNGGLGAVQNANKNVQLIPGQVDYASEGLTAAPKADGSGYWVVTYTPNTTRIVAVPFSNSGTPGAPVYTNSPFVPYKSAANAGFGSINFNADYTKLVLMAGYHCTISCNWYNGMLRLSTFDTATGIAGSLQDQNTFAWDNYHLNTGSGYSADFSPTGDYVYTTTLYEGWVYRYRIANATSGSQIESSFDWGTRSAGADTMPNAGNGGGQVVRGPDGKMYVANWGANAISVISNPDVTSSPYTPAPGGVGWGYNSRSLCVSGQPCDANNSVSRYGLPQMVTIYSPLYLRY